MKKSSETQRIKWRTVWGITLCWLIAGLFFITVLNHLFILSIIQEGGLEAYRFDLYFFTWLAITPVAGFTGGMVIVFFQRERFRKYPLGISLLLNMLTTLTVVIVLTVPGSLIYNSIKYALPPWNTEVLLRSLNVFDNYILWYNILFWGMMAAVTIIFLHVNEKYGQGVFFNLLVGRYYRPQVEERVFMFLDLKSSTTIAERLGHKTWFRLLNDFYNDSTEAIVDHKGEIYQYVGDEVVISWPLQKGLERRNCLSCFLAIKEAIGVRSAIYRQRYGLVPDFKAALHSGSVTVGEIGRIKKEIIFTGDTLNTCARILELCNYYKADLLLSEQLKAQLCAGPEPSPRAGEALRIEQVGVLALRGKQEPVSIFKVTGWEQ